MKRAAAREAMVNQRKLWGWDPEPKPTFRLEAIPPRAKKPGTLSRIFGALSL